MEFEEITIENFGTIEYVKLKLNSPGMILITGVNKDAPKTDSNGAGKSLLLDAICWCLWDNTTRKLSGDEVVRRKHGKDCCVKLKIKDGATTYLVVRHRKDSRVDKPNDLRLFVNGVEKGKKMKGLQEKIDQIVGFDFDTFCAMMPGAGINIATLTDVKIKELLEKLLQTEQLSSAYTAARERLRTLESGLSQANTILTQHRAALVTLEKEVSQLRDLEKSFAQTKAANCINIEVRVNQLTKDVVASQVEIDKCPELIRQATVFKNEIKDLNEKIVALERPANAAARLLSTEIEQKEQTVTLLDHDEAGIKKRIKQVEQLSGECPTCQAAITPEHVSHAVAELQKKITDAEPERTKLTGALHSLRRKYHHVVNVLANELVVLNGQVQMKTMAMNELMRAADEAARHGKLQERFKADLLIEQDRLAKAQAEQHNFAEIFQTKAEKAFTLAQQISGVITTIKMLSAEEKLCSFWVEGFAPSGLRSYMLDYVTPVLNDRAAYYSQLLTGDEMKVIFTTKTALKTGDVRDKFQIQVEQAHGGDLYKAASKGEKARADLVIAMALGDLATFRTTKQLPWRFLDEPFESIDDAGNEAVMHLLNDQKARFKTVFVVTHKPAFKKLFNQRIVMVKENEISTLVQDSNI